VSYASSILGLLPGGRRAPGIAQLVSKIEGYLPPEQVERVREAFDYAEVAHKGQKRQSGEAYITHPVAVADILADLHLDGPTLTAAILHDVVEDTPSSMAEVEQKFGKEVADLVDGVTKLDQVQFKSRKEAQAESFRKMILAMVRDIRVIMVKLADRTHNMRTIAAMPPESAARSRARRSRSTRRSPTASASTRSSSSSRRWDSTRCIRSATASSSASSSAHAATRRSSCRRSSRRCARRWPAPASTARSRRARSTCTAST
jgi:(p)ppGpp synthase/HD superfamily hydrolase